MLPMPGVQVQSLVEGLKSHMPCSMAKFFFFFKKNSGTDASGQNRDFYQWFPIRGTA